MASIGATVNHIGSRDAVEYPTILASGLIPLVFAFSADISTTAAAPSLMVEAFPAVTVPSFWNAGFRDGSLETFPLPGSSSTRKTTGSPFFCGISTPAISLSNFPSLIAASALW